MAYTPPINPNVDLNFVTDPYTPQTNPNVNINFGPDSGGGSQQSSINYNAQNASFFLLFDV